MIDELKAATDDIVAAFGDQGVNSLAMMDAVKEVEMAKQEIILSNVEYSVLKNEGQRSAFLAGLLGPLMDKVAELNAASIAIGTRIKIADAKIRLAKYAIISKAGKIVA